MTYVPALDGMRGISLPGTIYTHFQIFLGFLPTTPWWVRRSGPFTLNIEMFFVLSGALITSLLVAEYQRSAKVALDSFYLRRSRRLGPALLAVVPLLLIAQYWLPGASSTPLGRSPLVTALFILLFVGNWQLATGGNLGWLGPAWTLGIEEQFYLTWPALLRATLRRGWDRRHLLTGIWILIVLSSAIGLVLARVYGATNAVYMTPSQIAPILLGCALGYSLATNPDGWFARLLRYRTVALAGLGGMVAISALLYTHLAVLIGAGYVLYGGSACLLIGHCLAVADRPSIVSRVLGWRPFVVIGQVSYEAYLVHCIVILGVLRVAPRMPVPDMIVLDLALIAAISAAFYYFVEQPIRRYGWRAALRRHERPVRPVATRPAWSHASRLAGVATAGALVVAAVVVVATAKPAPSSRGSFSAGARVSADRVSTGSTAVREKGAAPGQMGRAGGAASPVVAAVPPTLVTGGRAPTSDLDPGSASPSGVMAAPTVTSIDPATGSVVGGNSVTIRGRHFIPGAMVFFDSMRAGRVARIDGHTLRVVVPPARAVAVHTALTRLHGLQVAVRVVTAGGTSAGGVAPVYTYV